MHNDDSGMRILRLAPEPGDKWTGIFTSGMYQWWAPGPSRCSSLDGNMRARISRGAETARTRTARAHPDERRVISQLAEGGRRRAPAGELPRAWKAADCGGGNNFPEECRYVLETLRDVYHHDA